MKMKLSVIDKIFIGNMIANIIAIILIICTIASCKKDDGCRTCEWRAQQGHHPTNTYLVDIVYTCDEYEINQIDGKTKVMKNSQGVDVYARGSCHE